MLELYSFVDFGSQNQMVGAAARWGGFPSPQSLAGYWNMDNHPLDAPVHRVGVGIACAL
jgi:hypothetical protein